jgi:hypothetical protein
MSTKLNPFQFNFESFKYFKICGESEKVAITKVVSNYTFFLQKFSGNFSHPLAIFPWGISISAVYLRVEKNESDGPLFSDRSQRRHVPLKAGRSDSIVRSRRRLVHAMSVKPLPCAPVATAHLFFLRRS